MAAAAERGVDVGAVRPDRQRGDGFLDQDGDVGAIGHQRLKPSSSAGRPPAGNVIARAVCSCHLASSHSSNLLPWPTRTTRWSSPAYWRSGGRNEDASRAVHLDFVGVTDEKALQSADLLVERRQRHQARLDRLPRGARVDEQAAARVGGDDERAFGGVGATRQRVAVLGGNREPALGVERELGHAAKHGPRRTRRTHSSLRHRVAPAASSDSEYLFTCAGRFPGRYAHKIPLQTHFLPLDATIREEISRGQLISFFLQELKPDVAQKSPGQNKQGVSRLRWSDGRQRATHWQFVTYDRSTKEYENFPTFRASDALPIPAGTRPSAPACFQARVRLESSFGRTAPRLL